MTDPSACDLETCPCDDAADAARRRSDGAPDGSDAGGPFAELAASRRAWIETVLRPWCRTAPRRELLKAEQEWLDIAGRVEPQFTLWLWAWSRFPVLFVDGLQGLDETFEVRVTLTTGEQQTGFPNARQSRRGLLTLVGPKGHVGPWSIDDVVEVVRVDSAPTFDSAPTAHR